MSECRHMLPRHQAGHRAGLCKLVHGPKWCKLGCSIDSKATSHLNSCTELNFTSAPSKLFPKRHSHLPHHRHPTTSPRLIIIYAFGRLGQLADESLACPHSDDSAAGSGASAAVTSTIPAATAAAIVPPLAAVVACMAEGFRRDGKLLNPEVKGGFLFLKPAMSLSQIC